MLARKTFLLITTLFVSLGLVLALGLQTAEAKRLGSGGSFGQHKQNFSRQAAPPTAANAVPGKTAAAPAAAGTRSWMGPLAGLAAGGLLAALFFGGAFDGLKPMDLILFALLAFGAFMIIRALRRSSAPAQPAMTPYANTGGTLDPANTQTPARGFEAASFMGSTSAPLNDAPHWFNETSFLAGAQHHFTNLQQSWDANDLKALQEYFTPDLFAELTAERARIGDINNVTEVQSLDAQLLDLTREGADVVASVLFQGRVRENYGLPENISEIWHVRHTAAHAEGDWLISGIQQYTQPVH